MILLKWKRLLNVIFYDFLIRMETRKKFISSVLLKWNEKTETFE